MIVDFIPKKRCVIAVRKSRSGNSSMNEKERFSTKALRKRLQQIEAERQRILILLILAEEIEKAKKQENAVKDP
jgi:hypothetical protein